MIVLASASDLILAGSGALAGYGLSVIAMGLACDDRPRMRFGASTVASAATMALIGLACLYGGY